MNLCCPIAKGWPLGHPELSSSRYSRVYQLPDKHESRSANCKRALFLLCLNKRVAMENYRRPSDLTEMCFLKVLNIGSLRSILEASFLGL